MNSEELARTIYMLKEVLRVQDLEIKNCALESIIDNLEEILIKTQKENIE